jgi:hypothetical protein
MQNLPTPSQPQMQQQPHSQQRCSYHHVKKSHCLISCVLMLLLRSMLMSCGSRLGWGLVMIRLLLLLTLRARRGAAWPSGGGCAISSTDW